MAREVLVMVQLRVAQLEKILVLVAISVLLKVWQVGELSGALLKIRLSP